MSGIYGTTINYNEDIISKKMDILKFRGRNYTEQRSFTVFEQTMILAQNSFVRTFDTSSFIVLDGAIYNRIELARDYLERERACKLDIEVLYALYQKYGTKCLNYLNGDFAFVIYDEKEQKLFGAKDRLGSKPLFYHLSDRGFEFASQLFPLCVGNKYSVNDFARKCYFTTQYVPEPLSIIDEVKKLEAGTYFEYILHTKEMIISRYWDIHYNTSNFTIPKSYNEALEITDFLLKDAIGKRVDNEVEYASFLSGGIDSSLITAYLSKINPKVEFFSMGFNEADFDEFYYSKAVAEKLGIKHNNFVCTSKDAENILLDLQKYYDEPMGDASALPTSFLCQLTNQRVPIAFGGDGGDELFLGYNRYLFYSNREWIYKIPYNLRYLLASVVQSKNPRLALSLKMNSVQEVYLNRRQYYDAELFDALAIQMRLTNIKYLYGNKEILKAFSDYDTKSDIANIYSVKIDRAAVRCGLDVRLPFLDYRLTEYTRLLPVEYLYDKKVGQKRILRDLLYRDIPKELFERKKMGFGVPIVHWFRKEMKDIILDNINMDTLVNIPEYNREMFMKIRDIHLSGEQDNTTVLWLMLNYIKWYKLFKEL